MKKKNGIIQWILLLVVCFLFTCGSSMTEVRREEAILKQYSADKKERYADLLVDINQYTTQGDVYQKRYHKYLIGIAGDIVEKKKMTVVRKSIGFYYDKKSGKRNMLYLGLDVHSQMNFSDGFRNDAIRVFKKNIKEIMHTLNSCRTLFNEKQIVGMVIGWRWLESGYNNSVSIWINENDVSAYEGNNLTLDEVIQRSTITNRSGKIIRIP